MPRYFTLDEARKTMPLAARSIREAVQAKSRCDSAEVWLHRLSQRILMQGGMTVDTALVESRQAQRESSSQTLRNALAKLEDMGVVVKDLDVGLVDFPTLFRGEEVYLCWRMDEDDIGHWHGVNEGFAGRRAIDRHFIENHRGGEVV